MKKDFRVHDNELYHEMDFVGPMKVDCNPQKKINEAN